MAIKGGGNYPPILSVSGESMAEAWEKSCLELERKGKIFKRDDEKDCGDQLDSYMTIEIRNPDANPFSHKKGGTNAVLNPLLDYYFEMLGMKDSWIKDFNNPEDTTWDYLYHERLGAYPNPTGEPIDQIEFAIKRLINRPFSRRNKLITWYPERDTKAEDTPCLQGIWFYNFPGDNEKEASLDMHYNFRSRNVVNASFGNIQGLYILGCHIRDKVEEATGKKLAIRMIDNIDSYHVNSKDLQKFYGNMKQIKKSIRKGEGLEERTFTREEVIDGLEYARKDVEEAIIRQTAKNFQGDIEQEKKRIHKTGDRIFYLLNKYTP